MFGRPDYTEIEHTADVGFELSAPDLRSALERAAAAMFDLVCDLETVRRKVSLDVEVVSRPGDQENLLVRWLTELLYVRDVRRLLLSGFEVRAVSEGKLEATVTGEEYDPGRHAIRNELKAPTYHDLELAERDGRWRVRVIFDT